MAGEYFFHRTHNHNTRGMIKEQNMENSSEKKEFTFGVVKELGELGSGAVISESGLADMLNRHRKSIKRAVRRGELPPPTKLLGKPVWTAGAIVKHIEGRLEKAQKDADKMSAKITKLALT
jgi:hypothetical protein